uniref:phosphoribosylaminoimidazolesuccinocarboxamide synthase n=1 Tax=Philodina roseola TaxID=96448 RepID=B2L3L7_PHIRO|nr:phosphoribosylaminoimidazole carboxylase [Philodina roseola]
MSNSSSSHGILGQKLFEGKTQTIYSVIDQSNLICIHQRDADDSTEILSTTSSNRRTSFDAGFRGRSRSHSLAENISTRATWITSINICVYEILREASIPNYFIAPHPQSDMFIAQKCTMIPLIWFIRRVANENYVKQHSNVPLGQRFVPPIVELCSQRRPIVYRRLTLSNLEETILNSDRTNVIDDENDDDVEKKQLNDDDSSISIFSSDQLAHLPFDISSMKISTNDLELMYEICLTLFDILEHVWMTTKKYQLIDLKLEFGLTTTKDIVVAHVFDVDSWHILRCISNDFIEDNLCLINQSLKEILHLNVCVSSITNEIDHLSINLPSNLSRCLIVVSSFTDIEYGQKIKNLLNESFNLWCEVRLCSMQNITKLLTQYSSDHCRATVIVTLGQLSNGLTTYISSNCLYPVLHCFLPDSDRNSFVSTDFPPVMFVFGLVNAVQSVIQILSMNDWRLWVKQRGRRWKRLMEFLLADQQLINKGTTSLGLSK